MFDIQATLRPHPDTPDPAQAGIAARDNRPVTPRRPLRLTSARTADAPAAAPPVANIFNGVFDIEERPTDPRLQRSRTRARNLLAAHEAVVALLDRLKAVGWRAGDPLPLEHEDPPATE